MSAELYDAVAAGAMARPAVDVLPVHGRRKDEAAEAAVAIPDATVPQPVAAEPLAPAGSDVPDPSWPSPWGAPAPAGEPVAAEPLAAYATAEASAPAKFLGLTRRRPRKARGAHAGDPAETADLAPEAFAEPVAGTEQLAELAPAEASEPAATVDIPLPEVDPVAELTAQLHAVAARLDASERARTDSEARAAQAAAYVQQAQAQLQAAQQEVAAARSAAEQADLRARKAEAEGEDWRIRHREAEATVGELTGSLGGAEQRIADLLARMDEVERERDDLLQALEDATRPDRAAETAQQ